MTETQIYIALSLLVALVIPTAIHQWLTKKA